MFFIRKKSIGIDVADHTVEVIELSQNGRNVKITALGRILLDKGIVEKGRIKDKKILKEKIEYLLSNADPSPIKAKDVVVGFPERHVYTHIFRVENSSPKDVRNKVLQELSTNIPLPENDIAYSYEIFRSGTKKDEVVLIAASKEVLREWNAFFKELNMQVIIFDTEMSALHRSIYRGRDHVPVCVVDIGRFFTNIAIFGNGHLWYTHTVDVAGDAVTNEIGEALKMDYDSAELEKMKTDLSIKNTASLAAIKPLRSIMKEIKIAMSFYLERESKNIEEIVLAGGGSRLKGVVSFFSGDLGIPVYIGNPISNYKHKGRQTPDMLGNLLVYAEAIGLALLGFEKDSTGIGFREDSFLH